MTAPRSLQHAIEQGELTEKQLRELIVGLAFFTILILLAFILDC